MNDEYGFNDQEHFYDMRLYKSEIEKMLDIVFKDFCIGK